MRMVLNENVSATVIAELRQRGHDILSVKESMQSASDEVILARAQSEQRLVVTHDKDFGELAFGRGCPLPAESFYCGSQAPTATLTTGVSSTRSRAVRIGLAISRW